MPSRKSCHPSLLVPAVIALGVALGGCSSDAPTVDDPAAATSAVASGAPGLQLREVTTTAEATGEAAPTEVQRDELDTLDCDLAQPSQPAEAEMTACDAAGEKYLLAPAEVDGGVESATAEQDAGGAWGVAVVLGPDSSQRLADLTGSLVGTSDRLAVVFQGEVLAAPLVQTRITEGRLTISGDYTEAEATDLAEKVQAGG